MCSSDLGTKVRRVKLKGEIVGKTASALERDVYGQNCKFVPETFKLENAHKMNCLHVYGAQSDKETLDRLYGAFKKSKANVRIKFIMFSERELTNLAKIELHNWIKLEDFMKGENKPFKRLVTAYLIEELSNKYRYTFDRINNMKSISEDLYNKLCTLHNYEQKYCAGYMSSDTKEILFKGLLEIAEPSKLYDGETYPIYLEVKAILDKHPFIETVFSTMSSYNEDSNVGLQQVVVDLFKYNKQRVNVGNYGVKLTEDAPLEQELTEETIDELAD